MDKNIEELTKKAEQGDSESQFDVGKMYFCGKGVKQNYSKAVKWWTNAAEQDEPRAVLCLSLMYRKGDGIEKNREIADSLHEKAINSLDSNAIGNLIDMYNEFRNLENDTDAEILNLTGLSFEYSKEYKQAKRYYERAASLGDIRARISLGLLYLEGNGVKKNYKKALELFKNSSQDSFAQWLIGTMYEEGKSVVKDYKQAKEWYEKAALNGSTSAFCSLGELYEEGHGVEQNYQKARDYFEVAGEKGDTSAQYHLGYMYSEGDGVEQDYEKAIYWYTKLADKGEAEAQSQLGWIYKYQMGNSKKAQEYFEKAAVQDDAFGQFQLALMQDDAKIAFPLFEKAAQQGLANAQYFLGDCYRNGKGTVQNIAAAIEWYEKAAAQGNSSAQDSLGDLYFEGEAVEQDYQKAFEWYVKAGKNGDQSALTKLAKMFYKGEGVEQDFTLAFKLFKTNRVLNYDHDGSIHFTLGHMYENGEGTQKNLKRALEYYEKSAKVQNENAIKALERLENLKEETTSTEVIINKNNKTSSLKYEKLVKNIINCANASKSPEMILFVPYVNWNNLDSD